MIPNTNQPFYRRAFQTYWLMERTGISAGYATEIPTHNLAETIQATIYLMDHPDATLEDLMKFVKGLISQPGELCKELME